jgi:hypothetical protein
MESWPARWRGVRSQDRCSRRWSSASAPAPRPQLVHVPLPPARRGVVPGVSTASRRCSCSCSGPAPGSSLARRDAVAARLLLPPSRRKQGGGEWKTPRGVGGLASVPRRPSILLNRGSEQPEGEMPPVPLAVRRARQVALEAGAWVHLGCSVERVVGSFTSPAVESNPARTHRPSACGPPGWRGRPIARPGAMRHG